MCKRASDSCVSIDVAAARIGLLGLFIEVDRCRVQVVAFRHQFVHSFTAFKQVLQVLVDDVLHILELFLNLEQLVGFKRVLPVTEEDLHLCELERMVSIEGLVEDASRLELVSKLHDQLVQASVGSPFVILIVSEGCGRNAVQSDPTVALAHVVL